MEKAIQNNLPLIVWKHEYDLGIHIVDEHHRGILAVINSLDYEMQRQQSESILMPIFKIMQEYTHIHFKIEEAFFNKFDFQDAIPHCAIHSELMETLNNVGDQCLLNNDPCELMDFLKKWWIDHIRMKDREFRDYLLGER